ncbi:ATP-dependent RNA helicase-like protein rok1 [Phyllosticta capitalensis]
MDFLKVLSRGTSLSKGAGKAAQSQKTQKTPSSGASSNPQLFGHDTTEANDSQAPKASGRKRKRAQAPPATTIDLPPELDFFRDPSHAKNDKKEELDDQTAVEEGKDNAARIEEAKDEAQPMDEEECKRILRSHKVKVTVLEDYNKAKQEQMEAERKSKKRKKSKESVEAPAKKKAKEQLYPEPLTSFKQLRSRHGISRRLAENIEAQGYSMPTEVQLASLPLLLQGTAPESNGIDLLTVAPTGSGKTLAFLIPLVHSLLQQKHERKNDAKSDGIQAVILAPTKELASQIVNEGRKMSLKTGIKVSLMRKGMEVVKEDGEGEEAPENDAHGSESDSGSDGEDTTKPAQRRKRGQLVKSDIIVSTPLALLHAIQRSKGSVAPLKTVKHLVLDEADVLLDPLFRQQTLDIWNAMTNPLLRVSLWSATMGSSIEELAISTINSRWSTLASESIRPNLIRLIVGLKDSAVPNIHHQLTYAATEQGKLLAVRQLLHPTAPRSLDSTNTPSLRPPFLIFTQTIPRAQALHSELQYDIPPEAGGSSRIAVLHSSLSSKQRDDVMTRFRRGEVWVLITTDLLARGVDFRGINGVVNYDAPTSGAAYVHRVGRTGRAGRTGGVAVTLYTEEDIPYIKNIANVIRRAEQVRGIVDEKDSCVKQWLLDALPTPTKRDKKELKRRGVEARRAGVEGERTKGRWRTQISTRSGFEKRVDRNRREAVEASRKRKSEGRPSKAEESGSEFGGFDE